MKKIVYFLAAIAFLALGSGRALADTNDSASSQSSQAELKIVNGWQTENGKKYYYRNGQAVTGLQKIGKSHYLFANNGQLYVKNVKTKKSYYWISKSGKVTGIKNYAKVISQLPQMPTGCEITAVTMMLNFAGKKVSKYQAAKVMHYSSNPNKGFIGSPYKKWPLGYWVAPDGIKSVVKHYLGKSQVMTGASMTAIKNKLLEQHLVVMWVGMFDGISNHAIALTGYHSGKIYYNDPWTGTKRSIKEKNLKVHWALDKYRALSY